MQNHKYGWIKDETDKRDVLYNTTITQIPANLPPTVDLRKKMPLVYNQGNLGSCSANATAAVVDFARGNEHEFYIYPSRLFIYYNTRLVEGTVDQDAGGQIRDAIKTTNTYGDIPEGQWPYDIKKFTDKPPETIYTQALKYKSLSYVRINDFSIDEVRAALAGGFPFAFGFQVFESFESPEVAKTGNMPIPKPGEAILGGHAVVAVGYDDSKQVIIVRNSWGADWGDKGHFYMPYEFMVSEQTSDFWQIKITT